MLKRRPRNRTVISFSGFGCRTLAGEAVGSPLELIEDAPFLSLRVQVVPWGQALTGHCGGWRAMGKSSQKPRSHADSGGLGGDSDRSGRGFGSVTRE